MKKLLFALLAISIVLVFTLCIQKKEDNRTIITKKIQYDVPILNDDPSYDWWINNIEGSDREELLDNIFGRVLSGDIQAYDYFNQPIDLKQIEVMLTDSILMTLKRTYEPYEVYDTLIVNKLGPADVTKLRFLEEWKYDEKSLFISKEVKGICPVTQVTINGQEFTRPLFWVHFDKLN